MRYFLRFTSTLTTSRVFDTGRYGPGRVTLCLNSDDDQTYYGVATVDMGATVKTRWQVNLSEVSVQMLAKGMEIPLRGAQIGLERCHIEDRKWVRIGMIAGLNPHWCQEFASVDALVGAETY
jgi:hypothetical protein